MRAILKLLPHTIPDPFHIQLMKLLNQKVNSCWSRNVKGFWLKIPVDEKNQFDCTFTEVKIEISFLKPIEGAQMEFRLTQGDRGYLSDDENTTNDVIMTLHNKNLLKNNLKCLIDTVLFKIGIKVINEDFVARQIWLKFLITTMIVENRD
ncbi:MAG: hypothetical protein HRT54_13045 [Colwellia sp.]|nr:hypothetical protein [Colwellia sp.]